MKTTMSRQMFTRRWFIGGAAAFGASTLTRAFAVPSDFADRRPGALRLGVISDIHIASSLKDGRVLALMPDRVAAALRFFRDRAVDAVAICGDLASFGTKAELMELARVWNETFPDGRRPDGAPVEKLFIMGNHDWEGWTYNKFAETFVPSKGCEDGNAARGGERRGHMRASDRRDGVGDAPDAFGIAAGGGAGARLGAAVPSGRRPSVCLCRAGQEGGCAGVPCRCHGDGNPKGGRR